PWLWAMRPFQETTRSFGFRVALPSGLILLGTVVAVVVSLAEVSQRADRLEEARIGRAAEAAIAAFVEHVGQAHEAYARAAVAGDSLADVDVASGLMVAATRSGAMFDTA